MYKKENTPHNVDGKEEEWDRRCVITNGEIDGLSDDMRVVGDKQDYAWCTFSSAVFF